MAQIEQEPPCVGYIQLVFFDNASNEVVCLGGAGFVTAEEDAAAWANIPVFVGESNFMADRMDASRDIVDDKPVSAGTCERLLGQSIASLIAQGRVTLAAELAVLCGDGGVIAGTNRTTSGAIGQA